MNRNTFDKLSPKMPLNHFYIADACHLISTEIKSRDNV